MSDSPTPQPPTKATPPADITDTDPAISRWARIDGVEESFARDQSRDRNVPS